MQVNKHNIPVVGKQAIANLLIGVERVYFGVIKDSGDIRSSGDERKRYRTYLIDDLHTYINDVSYRIGYCWIKVDRSIPFENVDKFVGFSGVAKLYYSKSSKRKKIGVEDVTGFPNKKDFIQVKFINRNNLKMLSSRGLLHWIYLSYSDMLVVKEKYSIDFTRIDFNELRYYVLTELISKNKIGYFSPYFKGIHIIYAVSLKESKKYILYCKKYGFEKSRFKFRAFNFSG